MPLYLSDSRHQPRRGPSDSSISPQGVGRLFFTARIKRPPLYRGGSASKKDGCPSPLLFQEMIRNQRGEFGWLHYSLTGKQ